MLAQCLQGQVGLHEVAGDLELVDLRVILLDMLMPKLSGLEVLRALRGEDATRAVPVLILSNSSRESDIAEVTRLGISGYFVKSNLSLQELGELVGRLLANPQ